MGAVDVGLLIVRLAVGAAFAAHGAQKVFGWWEGPGFAGWTTAMARRGLRPVWFWAAVSSGIELAGGALLIVGLATPLTAALLVAQSTYIIVKVHWSRGWFNGTSGIEFPVQLLAASLLLVMAGPGAISLDATIGVALDATVRVGLVLIALAGVALAIVIARPPAAPPETKAQRPG